MLRFAHGTLQGLLDQLDRLRDSHPPTPPGERAMNARLAGLVPDWQRFCLHVHNKGFPLSTGGQS